MHLHGSFQGGRREKHWKCTRSRPRCRADTKLVFSGTGKGAVGIVRPFHKGYLALVIQKDEGGRAGAVDRAGDKYG